MGFENEAGLNIIESEGEKKKCPKCGGLKNPEQFIGNLCGKCFNEVSAGALSKADTQGTVKANTTKNVDREAGSFTPDWIKKRHLDRQSTSRFSKSRSLRKSKNGKKEAVR